MKILPNKLWGVKCWYEFKFKPLKFELQNWTPDWNPTQTFLSILEISFEFIFGGFIKMYFINKLAQALVSFVSTKFVLCNAANDWDVCLKINH